ncbi:uncharacterized protein BX663DRAFT_443488 [Cokeromyces recurvatus]|uniref:uncharacterized protein n=1 Tax=Cokeromyces recurvatus TaxID=90255 RepID=UPI00221F2E32|nr:uncharacterized protein BX663DRAFT_443488 [Cokeromyces recurvatus]KAI7898208.1 hypothetical protein BX663DRAFT_443488 [Cokeromyces recurvatus]
MSSIVKTHSPLSGKQSQQGYYQLPVPAQHANLGKLEHIFQSIKRQIEQWGENAKWKIDLVLLDNNNNHHHVHPLLSPQQLHPNAITTPYNDKGGHSYLPITSTIQYPWDYIAPTTANNKWKHEEEDIDELQQKLRESLERQKYLEKIIWSQAEQIKRTSIISDKENAINTMKNIFLMTQNEQKTHHLLESNLLNKDIEILVKKLKKMASTLDKIEHMSTSNLDDKESLFKDRTLLMRKLHLAELRLSARDAEIEYLHEIIDTLNANVQESNTHLKKKKYLFQQQYSPDYRLSGLESLGIVADQMLNHEIGKRPLTIEDDSADEIASITSTTTTNTNTSSPDLQRSYENIPKKPRSTYTRWTEEEDRLLRRAVQKYGHSNWEACSKEIKGRSNIQCRNRWIRHLEHKPVPIEEHGLELNNHNTCKDARQSPSIAALLNTTNQDYLHPNQGTYRPPSPMPTPKKHREIQ